MLGSIRCKFLLKNASEIDRSVLQCLPRKEDVIRLNDIQYTVLAVEFVYVSPIVTEKKSPETYSYKIESSNIWIEPIPVLFDIAEPKKSAAE